MYHTTGKWGALFHLIVITYFLYKIKKGDFDKFN